MDKPRHPGKYACSDALLYYYERLDEWKRNQGRGGGSTMYDRGAGGSVDLPSGQGHSTQFYDDGYRLSRDTDGQADSQVHWTDQSVRKGSSKRHKSPRRSLTV